MAKQQPRDVMLLLAEATSALVVLENALEDKPSTERETAIKTLAAKACNAVSRATELIGNIRLEIQGQVDKL